MQSGPGAGMLGNREDIAEKTGLEESDMGGNSPNCMVLDQSIYQYLEKSEIRELE